MYNNVASKNRSDRTDMAESEKANAAQLAAWNSWKDVCWVHGLGKKLDARTPVVGTAEEERILAKAIKDACEGKLKEYKRSGVNVGEVDWAQEFDSALREFEICDQPGHEIWDRRFGEDNPHPRKPKAWKNHVWASVAASVDPPLKVIFGQLLGKKGFVRDFIEEWIRKNFNCHFEYKIDEAGKRKRLLVLTRSLDDPDHRCDVPDEGGHVADGMDHVGDGRDDADDDGVEAGGGKDVADGRSDVVDDAGVPTDDRDDTADDERENNYEEQPSQGQEMPPNWRQQLDEVLTLHHCAALYADAQNVKVYDDGEALAAIGCGKSTLNNRFSEISVLFARLDPEFHEWLRIDVDGRACLLNYLEGRLEKDAAQFLSRVKALEESAQRKKECER